MSERFLVDTNVWSEPLKKRPNPRVLEWLRKNEKELFMSSVSIGEINHGIQRLAKGRRRRSYEEWLNVLIEKMRGRVLSFTPDVALRWGQLLARTEKQGVRLPAVDSQIAAIALHHSLTLATRNQSDFEHTELNLVNPFEL